MSKKYLQIALFIILIQSQVFSQIKICGQIKDDKNNPIELIEIQLQNKDSIVFKSELTDIDGKFLLETEKGQYILIVRQLGVIYHKEGINADQDINIGSINITTKAQELGEVVIVSKKKLIERKVDRLIFNVENSIAAIGGNALDALKKTPMISVTQNDISLVGRGSVRVLINDRMVELSGEDLMNYLQTIASNDIKNIEVITTPPAKYEAEGSSGLINIVLKKGALNTWNNTLRMAYVQTTYPAYSIGNTLNYNKNKWAVTSSIEGKKGNEASILDLEVDFPNAKNVSQMRAKNQKDYVSGRLGADYNITDKSTIGGIVSMTKTTPDVNDNTHNSIFDDSNVQYSEIQTYGSLIETDKNSSANIHYLQKIDTIGRKLSVDFDYFNYSENRNRHFNSTQITNSVLDKQTIANNTGNQIIDNYSLKLDVEHPTKWINFTYGSKLSFSNTNSNVAYYDLLSGVTILDPLQTDNFKYQENTQSLYIDIAKNFKEKWDLKLGLRYENTEIESYSKTYNQKNFNNYSKFFPTAYILYNLNESNTLNLNYSRRISRPDFWELNPFRWYLNANSYAEGNPFLQPSFNHNLELTHGHKQKLFSTLTVQITEQGYGQVPYVSSVNNSQIIKRFNYYQGTTTILSENYNTKLFAWWESSNQFYIVYSDTKIYKALKNDLPVQNGWSSSFVTQNAFSLNIDKTFLGETTFNYTFPQALGIYKSTESYSLDFALKRLFLDKSLIASLAVIDVLKTSNPNIITYTNNIRQKINNYYDNRYFKFSLSYTFGNKKIQENNRSFGNEEEQNRTN